MSFDASAITTLTFDCYGTLIDWRGGARAALAALPSLVGHDPDELVRDWLALDRELVSGPYQPYGDLMAEALTRAADARGVRLPREEARRFADSQAEWPAFDESPAQLARLGVRFRLVILSNVETAVLERSMERLGGGFAGAVTAEQVRSYKPALEHFEEALRRFDLRPDEILHVAQSLWHDVRPAAHLGWRTAWVNREAEPEPTDVVPDLVASNLANLARELRCA